MKGMVVETNVLVVANQKASHVSPDCVLACIGALEKIKENNIVVIDSNLNIFREYLKYASLSGQPGAGDFFFKWLYNNQHNLKHCELVNITPKTDDIDDFLEFPNDPELNGFDRSDRKFVAVALTSKNKPKIVNATDSDWWNFRNELLKHDLRIEFLCPRLFKNT